MRVFALSVGRVGSTSLARACEHIGGFTAAHESRAALLGDERFAYPDQHIEVDHRLAWFLGDLARRFDDRETLYVHQVRDREAVVQSWLGRWDQIYRPTMVRAFGHGVIKRDREWSDDERRRAAEMYVDSVNANIAEFIARRRHCVFRTEHAEADFEALVDAIGAPCDLDAARAQLAERHNATVTRPRPRLSLRHVLPVVGPSAPSSLRAAQKVTLDAIDRSMAYSRDRVNVSVVGARFPDERQPAGWLVDAPTLATSSRDRGPFRVRRRLPLLREALDALRSDSPTDYLIYTNTDIAPQPYFYELVDELCREGYDYFTITRRDVATPFNPASRVLTQAKLGFGHPGTDCVVFRASLLDRIDVGDVLLGVKWVARTLIWQLALLSPNGRHFHDLHATYHLGYDRAWSDPRLADYEHFNLQQVAGCVERWGQRFGDTAVARLEGLSTFRRELASIVRSDAPPDRAGAAPPLNVQPRPSRAHRLVFCASPGRSGTGYLATLLGAAPGVDAGHERAPQMVGPWLRDVMWRGLDETYQHRLAKVDALQTQLSRLAPGTVYADTSHMFIKTFADVVFDRFAHDRLSVVVLRRDPVEIALSFHKLGFFNPAQHEWMNWLPVPTSPRSMVTMPATRVASDFDLIFGYLAEVELRIAYFRERTPDVRWVEAHLDDIATPNGAASLFDSLEIRRPPDLHQIVEQRVNERLEQKEQRRREVERELVAERLVSYLERFADLPGTDLLARQAGLSREAAR